MHEAAPWGDVRRRTWDNREGDLRHGSGGGAENAVRMGQSSRAKVVPSLEASGLHDEGGRRGRADRAAAEAHGQDTRRHRGRNRSRHRGERQAVAENHRYAPIT